MIGKVNKGVLVCGSQIVYFHPIFQKPIVYYSINVARQTDFFGFTLKFAAQGLRIDLIDFPILMTPTIGTAVQHYIFFGVFKDVFPTIDVQRIGQASGIAPYDGSTIPRVVLIRIFVG